MKKVVYFLLLFFPLILYSDPFLNIALYRSESIQLQAGAPPFQLIPVVVRDLHDTSEAKNFFRENNIILKSCGEDYCSGWATPAQIKELMDRFGEKVILSHRMHPLLNIAVPAIGGTVWHNGVETGFPVNGKGVLIGIIDTGIDIYHPDFKNPDGSTRIAFLWDQTISGHPDHYPEGFDYGYECDAVDINNLKCPSNDKGTFDNPSIGHGTHVAGIAAGNNSKYTGVAPEATLIVVKSLFDESSVVDAARYIINKANQLQMPVVINMSFGSDAGPHDGTTWVENELEKLVSRGRIIVAAAGNQADQTPHFSGVATAETGWLEIIPYMSPLGAVMDSSGENDLYLDIWSVKDINFRIMAVDENGDVIYRNSVNFSTSNCSCTSSGCNNLVCTEDVSVNGNKIATIGMSSGQNITNYKIESVFLFHPENNNFYHYSWFIGFQRDTSYDTRFDAWVVNSSGEFQSGPEGQDSHFVRVYENGIPEDIKVFYGDNWCTVTVPATAPEIIGVGSFVTRTSWIATINGQRYVVSVSGATVGDISDFSSRGGCNTNIYKPDITAPGEWIISSMSQNVNIDSQFVIDQFHDVMEGTSMASPMVAGGIALLLEMEEDLSFEEVRNLITSNAISDFFTGEVPNNIWGYGKFNLRGLSSMLTRESLNRDPLSIKNVKISVDSVYGEIDLTWQTNRLADTKVEYWSDNSSKRDVVIMSYSIRHQVKLSDLTEKKYYIKISATSPYDETVTYKTLTVEFPEPSTGCGCHTGNGSSFDPVLLLFLLPYFFVRRKSAREE